MKKIISCKWLVMFVLLGIVYSAKAELPPLGIPSIITLPHTFNVSDNYGVIDIDGDMVGDFYVQFIASGMGSSTYNISFIQSYSSSSSGNQVLGEFVEVGPVMPSSAEHPALSSSGLSYATILSRGDIVGNVPPSGSTWSPFGVFIYEYYSSVGTPLASNTTDGVYSGYVGTYFSGSGGWYYGWLNVEVDPAGNWVKINSAGHASTPASSVPAGLNDPFAVPIPIIASILGFGLIGGGIFLKRRKKK